MQKGLAKAKESRKTSQTAILQSPIDVASVAEMLAKGLCLDLLLNIASAELSARLCKVQS